MIFSSYMESHLNRGSEEVVCKEPLLTVDRQMGLNIVHPEGKVRRSHSAPSRLTDLHGYTVGGNDIPTNTLRC